jgi:hypothetical protein
MWLDRFERVDGQLMAVGITQSGSQRLLAPEQMQASSRGSGGRRHMQHTTRLLQLQLQLQDRHRDISAAENIPAAGRRPSSRRNPRPYRVWYVSRRLRARITSTTTSL